MSVSEDLSIDTLDDFPIGDSSEKSNVPHNSCGVLTSTSSLEVIRQNQIKKEEVINALNQFITQAGNIYKGGKLSTLEKNKLRDVATNAGLSIEVVDALLEQTADQNAVVDYCMTSDDTFVRKMKDDPHLSRTFFEKDEVMKSDDGLNVTNSMRRILIHKIIVQLLKNHDMQLEDIIEKSSLASQLYEETLGCEIEEGKFGLVNGTSQTARNYSEERKFVSISESEAKLARIEAESKMKFRSQSPFQNISNTNLRYEMPHDENRPESRDDDGDDDNLSIIPCANERENSSALRTTVSEENKSNCSIIACDAERNNSSTPKVYEHKSAILDEFPDDLKIPNSPRIMFEAHPTTLMETRSGKSEDEKLKVSDSNSGVKRVLQLFEGKATFHANNQSSEKERNLRKNNASQSGNVSKTRAIFENKHCLAAPEKILSNNAIFNIVKIKQKENTNKSSNSSEQSEQDTTLEGGDALLINQTKGRGEKDTFKIESSGDEIEENHSGRIKSTPYNDYNYDDGTADWSLIEHDGVNCPESETTYHDNRLCEKLVEVGEQERLDAQDSISVFLGDENKELLSNNSGESLLSNRQLNSYGTESASSSPTTFFNNEIFEVPENTRPILKDQNKFTRDLNFVSSPFNCDYQSLRQYHEEKFVHDNNKDDSDEKSNCKVIFTNNRSMPDNNFVDFEKMTDDITNEFYSNLAKISSGSEDSCMIPVPLGDTNNIPYTTKKMKIAIDNRIDDAINRSENLKYNTQLTAAAFRGNDISELPPQENTWAGFESNNVFRNLSQDMKNRQNDDVWSYQSVIPRYDQEENLREKNQARINQEVEGSNTSDLTEYSKKNQEKVVINPLRPELELIERSPSFNIRNVRPISPPGFLKVGEDSNRFISNEIITENSIQYKGKFILESTLFSSPNSGEKWTEFDDTIGRNVFLERSVTHQKTIDQNIGSRRDKTSHGQSNEKLVSIESGPRNYFADLLQKNSSLSSNSVPEDDEDNHYYDEGCKESCDLITTCQVDSSSSSSNEGKRRTPIENPVSKLKNIHTNSDDVFVVESNDYSRLTSICNNTEDSTPVSLPPNEFTGIGNNNKKLYFQECDKNCTAFDDGSLTQTQDIFGEKITSPLQTQAQTRNYLRDDNHRSELNHKNRGTNKSVHFQELNYPATEDKSLVSTQWLIDKNRTFPEQDNYNFSSATIIESVTDIPKRENVSSHQFNDGPCYQSSVESHLSEDTNNLGRESFVSNSFSRKEVKHQSEEEELRQYYHYFEDLKNPFLAERQHKKCNESEQDKNYLNGILPEHKRNEGTKNNHDCLISMPRNCKDMEPTPSAVNQIYVEPSKLDSAVAGKTHVERGLDEFYEASRTIDEAVKNAQFPPNSHDFIIETDRNNLEPNTLDSTIETIKVETVTSEEHYNEVGLGESYDVSWPLDKSFIEPTHRQLTPYSDASILDNPLFNSDDDQSIDAVEEDRLNANSPLQQDLYPPFFKNKGIYKTDPKPDPSPECSRGSIDTPSTPRLNNTTDIPEGASKEELKLLNQFIEVASSNFGGNKLSAQSESRVRSAALKVGLTSKFVDQLLNQQNSKLEDSYSALTYDTLQHLQHYEVTEAVSHAYENDCQNNHPPYRYDGTISSAPYEYGHGENSTYCTADYSRTANPSIKREPTAENCNVWESIRDNLGFLAKVCGVNNFQKDDASSVVSAISWEDDNLVSSKFRRYQSKPRSRSNNVREQDKAACLSSPSIRNDSRQVSLLNVNQQSEQKKIQQLV